MPRKLRGDPMQWSCKRERKVHNIHSSRSKGKFEVSLFILLKVRRLWETHCIGAFTQSNKTWRSKNFMSTLSISASQLTEEQRLTSQDTQHGSVILTRTSSTARRIVHERKVLRDAQIRNMNDIGEIKRVQEQQKDEVSVQK